MTAVERSEYVSVTRAAKMLGVHRRTVLSWIKKGYVRAHRLPSGIHRIPAGELLRVQEEMRKGGRDERE